MLLLSILLLIPQKKVESPEAIDHLGFNTIIVDTPESRQKGLGGRESLATSTAMLFVFDYPDKYGIWMKDMNFPIDILWLDKEGRIVHIEENISPETFPKTFFPLDESLYVLEGNEDFVETHKLEVGKTLDIKRR